VCVGQGFESSLRTIDPIQRSLLSSSQGGSGTRFTLNSRKADDWPLFGMLTLGITSPTQTVSITCR
jgi:hypothetical protein